MVPLVALAGRPNVGKSTLFNKITGHRTAIVDDSPGVTRDRLYGTADWNGRSFTLIDTGGLEPLSKDLIPSKIREQAKVAIESADVIVLVTDVQTGMTASDKDVAALLLKSGKPVLLCVNKCDNVGNQNPDFYEFYNLGLGEPFAVSSVHGHGTGDLLDAITESLDAQSPDSDEESEESEESKILKIAIVGKPNSGKSSLVNKIAGEERAIVSDIAGTTRDALDTVVQRGGEEFVIIDTAGLRKKSKINENIERYSVVRALSAVDRADVAVIMIDAVEGFSEQDSKIAGYAHEKGKSCVIAVNKWDLLPDIINQKYETTARGHNVYNLSGKSDKAMDEYRNKLMADFSFMSYAPYVFISAKTGQRIDKLFELAKETYTQNSTRIGTGRLNDLLAYATARVQPPSDRGKRCKLYYITQASANPPTFVVFCNKIDLFHFSYQRYIENQIREAFGLDKTPIKIIPRERKE
ncbi:MAG: ribosome biogenesis GTPase Der [Oscillospiraceae bacterium]|nr:ribosome biogenesis GTPase Der [Oscillospiraceae bacterium]